jgi:hypothetical protein
VELEPGSHRVVAAFYGRPSEPLEVELAAGDEARIEMRFGPGAFAQMTSKNPVDQLVLRRTDRPA